MKKILFILTITGFLFASCGNEKKSNDVGTHTHEDGTVHSNDVHDYEPEAMPKQESFEVEADSTNKNTVETHQGHEHDSEHNHQH